MENLVEVKIPEGCTTIGDWAFYCNSSLSSIDIPSSVSDFGLGAFRETPWLDSRISQAGNNPVCVNNVVITGEHCTDTVRVPEGTVKIGPWAFDSSTAESVILPDSVVEICYSAFSYMPNLNHLEVGKGLKILGGCVLEQSTNLIELELPPSLEFIEEDSLFGTWLDFVILIDNPYLGKDTPRISVGCRMGFLCLRMIYDVLN